MNMLQTDIIIVGGGGAGLRAAIAAAEAAPQLNIMLLSKVYPMRSHTVAAEGGAAAVTLDSDNAAAHFQDTVSGGDWLADQPVVEFFVKQAYQELVQLEHWGCPWSRQQDGSIAVRRFGGMKTERTWFAADKTGFHILHTLFQTSLKYPTIQRLDEYFVLDLLRVGEQLVGVLALALNSGELVQIQAKSVILATGGAGRVFHYNTNGGIVTGDGMALAYRHGVALQDMEFVQFHPTTFVGANGARFLITEAVRGDGGRLVHADNTPFMDKYDAVWKDLAPRDVVARAIYQEMLEHDVPYVYLNLRDYIPAERIRHHFPTILQRCADAGVDITNELVPVVPGAHYACGGVWVDEWGQSTLAGLYAVGEVACTGLHGANRLASTSLLEGLVWGDRAAQHIKANLHLLHQPNPNNYPDWEYADGGAPDPALIGQDYGQIKALMWNYVGLVRTTQRLERALRELRRFEQEIEFFYRTTHLTDGLIGLRNAARTATLVAQAAWTNRTSVGCHFRE